MLRTHKQGFVDQALLSWQNGQSQEALDILRNQRNPIARVLEVAFHGMTSSRSKPELVREEISRVAGLQLDNLRMGLRPFALIANISPLIGLLGTVLGMINAFQALQEAGNKVDPSILSGGIWVALLTTAAGLIIVIPAAAAHNWMEGIVYRVQRALEDDVTRVFTASVAAGLDPVSPGATATQPAE
jgi:biopolymer transport protein ExbB